MINEDIITCLKNAIDRGETLENAIAIATSSGYNPGEVEQAAKFIGAGVINIEKISNEQILTMPNKKGFFSKKPVTVRSTPPKIIQKAPAIQQAPQPVQQVNPLPREQTAQQIKQSLEIPAISPPDFEKKPGYAKEIILMVLLLILIGILIITVRYREVIIKFFSG